MLCIYAPFCTREPHRHINRRRPELRNQQLRAFIEKTEEADEPGALHDLIWESDRHVEKPTDRKKDPNILYWRYNLKNQLPKTQKDADT